MTVDRDHYGWGDFTLASPEAKRSYLGAMISEGLREYPRWVAELIGAHVAGAGELAADGGVDHQSVFSMPTCRESSWGNDRGLDRKFAGELMSYLTLDGVVVLGGNDNGNGHPLCDDTAFLVPWEREGGRWRSRKDEVYKFWTLFNPDNGNKIRLSFPTEAEPLTNIVPDRASAPELVDLKITNYCPKYCAYCYQGSGPEGQHASLEICEEISQVLAQLDVFEVAIGGGEPTEHPRFADIIEVLARRGILVNFTTAQYEWLDKGGAAGIIDSIGQFAYTPQGTDDMQKMYNALMRAGGDADKASIQIVLGTLDQSAFEARLIKAQAFNLQVVLLGYKTSGRGGSFAPKNYDWWVDSVKKLEEQNQLPKLGVDTTLAAAYQEQLEELKIPSWLYHTIDGRFSCYIDAVEEAAGPSSYSNKMTPFSPAILPGQRENQRTNDIGKAIQCAMNEAE